MAAGDQLLDQGGEQRRARVAAWKRGGGRIEQPGDVRAGDGSGEADVHAQASVSPLRLTASTITHP